MKRILLFVALSIGLLSSAISAEVVYVFPGGWDYKDRKPQINDVITHSHALTVLYPNRPCKLPVTDAHQFHGAETYLGNKLEQACWARVIDPTGYGIVILNSMGQTTRSTLMTMYPAEINQNGSMRITGRSPVERLHDNN